MSLNEFEVLGKLGEGAFATVFKVKRKSDGQVYAMKKVKFGPLSAKEKENALNEVRLLASFEHPNIIAYKDSFFDEGSTLCIITEFAEGGDLLAKIDSHKKFRSRFPEEEIWDTLIQISRGLQTLHSYRILHRDIKSANIFVSKNLIKIGDLNVSKVNKQGLAVTQTGTPYYACPEVWKDKPYNSSSDLWSVGCVIYEMAALRPPFMANDMKGLYEKVIKGIYPPLPPGYSQDLSQIISSMLQVNPVLRPTCTKLLDMDIVRRRTRDNSENVANNDLLSTIKFVPSIKELNSRLPGSNYEKRGRGKSISHPGEERDRSDSGARPRPGVSVENKRDVRIPRLPGLPPRYVNRNEHSDAHRYIPSEISLDRKIGRNNSYGDDRNRINRPLLQAGANVLVNESMTPKPVLSKASLERVLSEPLLDKQVKYNKK